MTTRNKKILLTSITLIIIASFRFLFIGRYVDSWDAVDFALGVERFDIFYMRPHFPGYPLFIIIAKLVNSFFSDSFLSLSITSSIYGVITIIFIYLTINKLFEHGVALFVALLSIFTPLLWLISIQPMSDSMGIALVWIVLWIISQSKDYDLGEKEHLWIGVLAAFIFGLSMGVRISYYPFAFVLIIPLYLSSVNRFDNKIVFSTLIRNSILFGLSLGIGILLWLLPISSIEGGVMAYLELGLSFTKGHFTDWGGTLISEGSLITRIRDFLFLIILSIGGLGWKDSVTSSLYLYFWVIIAILLLILKSKDQVLKRINNFKKRHLYEIIFLVLSIVPYSIWVIIGQNLQKSRHIAILIPFIFLVIILLVKLSINKYWKLWAVGLIAFSFMISFPIINQYASYPSPMFQMANWINDNYQENRTTIFTWEEERVINYLYPKFSTVRLRKEDDFENQILLYGENRLILVTNAVLDGFTDKKKYLQFLKPVWKIESNSFLYPTYNRIVLYQANSDLYNFLKKSRSSITLIDNDNEMQ
ncbi:hypothetical protein BHF71_04090 [Vulcanibacillus modesticaldus]|uniref:Glycosyltransferase RgtA/B/C/D-like domain-containing protein n=1 Tax=Vulcanibacillus modesticaldus TaxID=337097 RepID=A0A1D2YS83_9BACI|nr:DUF2723 domain-containing protein [Vulcanibacillus modesticaldus]OEF96915.1 hypothetical protein BHF71_04090 [Vulcanibacillus modesticaldus]